jgi:DNA adenine methylase
MCIWFGLDYRLFSSSARQGSVRHMAVAVPHAASRVASPLRWAGGKRWLLPTIRMLVGSRQFPAYHEPFLGGASVFLGLRQFRRAYLRDSNAELIATYRAIRDHYAMIAERVLLYGNDPDTYYAVRASVPEDKVEQAARFLYLNHTSFNGIYRVNLDGVYNVPFGNRPSPQIPTAEHLRNVSKRLNKANLATGDFSKCLKHISTSDLVFLDPPYTVAHNHNGFIKYNQRLFSFGDQKRLNKLIDEIKKRGAYYILANAAHESIADLFDNGDILIETSRRNSIGGINASRGSATEYLFTNLELPR